MHSEGYDLVRVFTNGCCRDGTLGDLNGGLNMAYIANPADFLQRAKAHGIFVLITGDAYPAYGGYIEILDRTWSANFAGANTIYLQVGGLLASSAYSGDLVDALLAAGAPVDYIFSYELMNEAFYESNLAPLSFTSGMITTANGRTYDMSSGSSKQLMMDENLVNWADALRSAIRGRDPTAHFPPSTGPTPALQAVSLGRT